jgi:hypothetical protein
VNLPKKRKTKDTDSGGERMVGREHGWWEKQEVVKTEWLVGWGLRRTTKRVFKKKRKFGLEKTYYSRRVG